MNAAEVKELSLSRIVARQEVQARVAMNEETIEEYAEAMRNGDTFPPVVVFRDDDVFCWLADGFHRFEAAKEAGRTFIQAEIRAGGKREAILFAVGANASHGLRRRNIDKRNSVLKLLKNREWSRWSDREIARQCNVDHKTVARIRGELSREIPQIQNPIRKVTRRGKTYNQNTRNIGRRRQRDEELEENQRELEEAVMSGEVDPADVPVRFETTAGSPRNEQTNSVEQLVSLYQALSYEEKQSFLEILNLAENSTDPGDEQQSIVAWVCEKNGLTEDELHEKVHWMQEGFYGEEEYAKEFGITTEQVMQLLDSLFGSGRPWDDEEEHTA